MDANFFKQVLDERNEILQLPRCVRQSVRRQRAELSEERIRREVETLIHDNGNGAYATSLSLEELANKGWLQKTTIGAHDQQGGGAGWQVLIRSQNWARPRKGEDFLQQFSDQESCAHRTPDCSGPR